MNSKNRIARTITGYAPLLSIGLSLALPPAFAQNPTPPTPSPATYKGCVQRAPGSDGTLLISTPNACAKLAGKLSADTLAGHEVELQGILTPRTASAPASIQVDSVTHVGAACSNVCTLHPRGLRRPQSSDVPGTEGGTPGAVAPHPAVQPQ